MFGEWQAWTTILLLGMVTLFTRVAGVVAARWIPQSPFAQRFFRYLPGTLLITLAVPPLSSGEPAQIAGVVAVLAVAMRGASVVVAMLIGMAVVAAVRALAGA